jgi:ATP-binding cassette subfamily B protein
MMQERIDTVNRVLREQITGIRVVRAFVREPYETDRFATANRELTETATTVGRLQASLFPIVMLILNISSVAVLWFGAQRIAAGEMQVGSLTAFLAYLIQILFAVMMATFLLMIAPRAAVSAERIGEVLQTESSVVLPAEPVTSLPLASTVEFLDTEFTYPGAESPVLRDIDLVARPGQTTAIIGSTGSGKSTLISLIPRLFDATGGTVRVDGVDVRDTDADLLWSRSAGAAEAVPVLGHGGQQPALRQPGGDRRRALARLRVRQAEDFVRAMPADWRRDQPRAARISRAVSGSGSRSPGPWSSSRRSTSSTTRSPHWTWPPTPGCGRRSRPRPGTAA